jgi:hypothetical protein
MNYFKKSFFSALLALLVTLTATAQVGIGTTTPSANTKFEIIAAGSTSATTSLRVGTASGTTLLSVKDNGSIGIGTLTPASSASLEVSSTTGGFLPPRMSNSQKLALNNPLAGLIIWCTDCDVNGQMQFYDGSMWRGFGITTANVPSGGGGGGTTTPTVTTNPVVSSTSSTASLSGSITSGMAYSPAGFYYSTDQTAINTLAGSYSSTNGSLSASNISATLSGLTSSTTYFVRAFASTFSGATVSASNTVSFTTSSGAGSTTPTIQTGQATTVMTSSANLQGSIVSGSVSSTGFYYSTNQADINSLTGTYSSTLANLTGSTFSANVSSLTSATTYYFRAYATTLSNTTITAANTVSFTTGGAGGGGGIPSVITSAAQAQPGISFILQGSFTSNGATIVSYGFDYAPTPATFTVGTFSSTTSSSFVGAGGGTFSATISSGLSPTTSYDVRAYVIYSVGAPQYNAYGSPISATTSASRSVASSYFSNISSDEISRTLMHVRNQPELPSAPLEGDRSSAVFIGRGRLNN